MAGGELAGLSLSVIVTSADTSKNRISTLALAFNINGPGPLNCPCTWTPHSETPATSTSKPASTVATK